MKFVRMIIITLMTETVLYVSMSLYLRSIHKEWLEKTWRQRHPDRASDERAMREFVRRGMTGFGKTIRARMVTLVFVIPTLAILATIIYVNR